MSSTAIMGTITLSLLQVISNRFLSLIESPVVAMPSFLAANTERTSRSNIVMANCSILVVRADHMFRGN